MRLHEKKRIDVKELLNREALNQEFNKSRLSDKYGVSDQYILLDSFIINIISPISSFGY
jgi:hypothetical protein